MPESDLLIENTELAALDPQLLKQAKRARLDPNKLIQEVIDEHGLTRKQATVLVYRFLGASQEVAGRLARPGQETTPERAKSTAQAVITKPFARTVQNNLFRRYHSRFGKHLIINRNSIISDLEVLKQKSTEDQHYSAAVRATELQARAAGISMSETIIVESDRLPDQSLISAIAGSDTDLAAKLRAKLGAVDGEWTELDQPHGIDSDDTSSNPDTDT